MAPRLSEASQIPVFTLDDCAGQFILLINVLKMGQLTWLVTGCSSGFGELFQSS